MERELIQEQLLKLLEGTQAHLPVTKILDSFPVEKINSKIDGLLYTPWELAEHMRIAQLDILEYIASPNYKELKFPDGYWPEKGKTKTSEDWKKTISNFKEDLQSLKDIILGPQTDFTALIKHNPNHSIFRELLIIGNHNSYHAGQLLLFTKLTG